MAVSSPAFFGVGKKGISSTGRGCGAGREVAQASRGARARAAAPNLQAERRKTADRCHVAARQWGKKSVPPSPRTDLKHLANNSQGLGTWVILATCGAKEREPNSEIYGSSGTEENVTGQQLPGFRGVLSSPPATQNQRKAARGRSERHLANNGQGPMVRSCYQQKNSRVQMPRAARGRSRETPGQRRSGPGDLSLPPTKVIGCTCQKSG
jgi:hypothetical protein